LWKVTHSIGIVIAFYFHCLRIFETVLWTSHVADMKKFIFSSIARALFDLLFCVWNYKSGLWLHLPTTMHTFSRENATWLKSYEGHSWWNNLFNVIQPSCLLSGSNGKWEVGQHQLTELASDKQGTSSNFTSQVTTLDAHETKKKVRLMMFVCGTIYHTCSQGILHYYSLHW